MYETIFGDYDNGLVIGSRVRRFFFISVYIYEEHLNVEISLQERTGRLACRNPEYYPSKCNTIIQESN